MQREEPEVEVDLRLVRNAQQGRTLPEEILKEE